MSNEQRVKKYASLPCHSLVLISQLDLDTPFVKKGVKSDFLKRISYIFTWAKVVRTRYSGMLSSIPHFENLHEVLYIDLK